MSLGWINPADYPFDCMALMEDFQIRFICQRAADDENLRQNLGIALLNSPTIAWCFARKYPPCAAWTDQIIAAAPKGQSQEAIRDAEIAVMVNFEDFVAYCFPEVMDSACDFIAAWHPSRLYEMADFTGKIVLDIGSGTGRLAFAAAPNAKHVFASEPVGTLRQFMREKICREGIDNVSVVDGLVDQLAYPDDTFDIVMSGHVVGDDFDAEVAEMARVVKNGGWILDCPGDEPSRHGPKHALESRGFEAMPYESQFGNILYRYRKQITK